MGIIKALFLLVFGGIMLMGFTISYVMHPDTLKPAFLRELPVRIIMNGHPAAQDMRREFERQMREEDRVSRFPLPGEIRR
jgi:hypothetical protein